MATYLGIDLGTSATKTVLVDGAGRVLARGRADHRPAHRQARGRVDTAEWARSVRLACHDLGDATRADAVGLAVHCPVAIPLDDAGDAVAPGLCWDHPALPDLVEAYAKARGDEAAALVGNAAFPATAMGLAWRFFAEHEPETLARTRTMGFVGTWLGHRLTGRDAIDPTQASYSGLFACTDGCDWIDDLAELVGVPRHVLPPVVPSLSPLGALLPEAAAELGLRPGIPVVTGAADTAAAACLLDIHGSRAPLYTVGTTHVVTRSSAVPDRAPRVLQRADVRPGRWLWHSATNGGVALSVAARLLGYGDAVEELIARAGAATIAQAEAAPVFIPHVTPERGPLWLERPRTALLGYLPDTDAWSAAWGAVEGVAFAVRLMLGDSAHVVMVGSLDYAGIVADLFGRPVHLVEETYLPAMGAAAMAAEGTDGVILPAPPYRRIGPRPEWVHVVAARWESYGETWGRIVGRPAPTAPPMSEESR
ncbi:FGGY-family carbohydrate kinase [Nonomuraea sp. NPDC050022]|uniref:xylulokinase n=1 Tax=unclassified Nonomuraea TaxID=2593643 RepID=UPI0033EEFCCD